jgi:protein-S-isoprenylcysteine O-methyltransferase Ste14
MQFFCTTVSLLEILFICSTSVPELSLLRPYFLPFLLFHIHDPEGGLSPYLEEAPVSNKIKLTPLFVLGCLLSSFGAAIRILSYRALGHMFTFEMTIRRGHKLVTTGPYAWVRHPGYTGLLCFVVGVFGCHAFEVRLNVFLLFLVLLLL